MTTDWRIVPAKPTAAMVGKAYPYCTDDAKECWDEIIAAAPRASEDEALVEGLVTRLGNMFDEIDTLTLTTCVGVVLEALEPPP